MGERKVLNKYYPPDFDPSKIPRRRQPKNQQIKVRMMLPMSIRCNTCGNYIYQGTKFNSRKEDVIGETYLGIQIFRFYFKCTKCSAEITMKTDPQNSDYTVEAGASRNYEPWRSTDEILDEAKKKRESEETGDAMKALENKTLDSKQEMDILSALDEMKSLQSRHALIDTNEMLDALRRTAELKEKELAAEDEAILRSVLFHNSEKFVRRVEDPDDDSDEDSPHTKKLKVNGNDRASATSTLVPNNKPAQEKTQSKPKILFNVKPKAPKEKPVLSKEEKPSTEENPSTTNGQAKNHSVASSQVAADIDVKGVISGQVSNDNALGALCASYDDDSSSE